MKLPRIFVVVGVALATLALTACTQEAQQPEQPQEPAGQQTTRPSNPAASVAVPSRLRSAPLAPTMAGSRRSPTTPVRRPTSSGRADAFGGHQRLGRPGLPGRDAHQPEAGRARHPPPRGWSAHPGRAEGYASWHPGRQRRPRVLHATAYRTWIGGDNYGIGKSAADLIANELNCQGNVVEIQGVAGISVTEQRTKGFTDGIKRCNGGIKIVASQPADFLPDKGLQVMETMLQGQKDIKAVYTTTTTWPWARSRPSAPPTGRTRCSSPGPVDPRTR